MPGSENNDRVDSHSHRSSSAGVISKRPTPLLVTTAVAFGVLMLAFHVKADAAVDGGDTAPLFLERVQEGPSGLINIDLILFGAIFLLAFELLQFLVEGSGKWAGAKLIPVRGKHLDELSKQDYLFIGLNKLASAPFAYLFLRYAYFERNIIWNLSEVSVKNTVFPLPCLYIVYDFFYTILHWVLHVKGIYGYIHKHHHHQKAPSRANVDAVNVHPLEFFLGEYNHLFTLYLCCNVLNLQIHIVGAILLLAIGGVLAGLNHTRYDVVVSLLGMKIYDSKAHDVHHRIPQSNYGQYIMFWDYVFGSFRAYDPTDRVNKMSQLDPKTGKSLAFIEKQKL